MILSPSIFPRRAFVAASLAVVAAPGVATPELPAEGSGSNRTASLQRDGVTLVNVFTAEPDQLPALIAILKDGTEAFFSKQPGFISSSVLVARDGRHAINYSQWTTAEAIRRFRSESYFDPYLQRILAVAKAETLLCDLVDAHDAPQRSCTPGASASRSDPVNTKGE